MVYLINDETLISIADAIREKSGIADSIDPMDMPELIKNIKSGDGIGYTFIPNADVLFFANTLGNLVDASVSVLGLETPMQKLTGTPKVVTVSVVEG